MRTVAAALTTLALGMAGMAAAQAGPAPSPAPAPAGAGAGAGAGAKRCSVTQRLELKTTMDGLKPLVTVGINGRDVRFVADSGAGYSNISSGAAAELGLKPAPLPPGFTLSGIGGEVRPGLVTIRTVDLGGVPLRDIQFLVGGSEIGHGAAGLLGQNVLGLDDVEYDLAHGAIRLIHAKDCKDAIPLYWAGNKPISVVPLLPRAEHFPHTVGLITVNGVRMRAIFDTGASGTVMSLAAAAKLGLKPGDPRVRAAGYGFGIGSKTVANYIVPIDSIKFGDDGEEVRRTHLRAEAIELDGDLLIGADFFRSHRVYVANGQRRLYFTYDGGPIFDAVTGRIVDEHGATVAVAPDAVAEPTDAEGYSRRGAAFLARRDLVHALADLDRAVALAPSDARYTFQRAQAYEAGRQPLRAMDDLDTTLKLDPANAEARLARASVRLGRHDRAAAEEDVATVDRDAAPAADARLTLAGMYGALDRFDQAIAQYDLWLRYHPDDSRRPTALNGRCWVRAEQGSDLGKALGDCDAAIRARRDNASYFDSRGLVRLRMHDDARAVADFDAALALNPRLAWSLYGRGLARQHLGDQAAGQKDIDAATAINADLPARARKLGVS